MNTAHGHLGSCRDLAAFLVICAVAVPIDASAPPRDEQADGLIDQPVARMADWPAPDDDRQIPPNEIIVKFAPAVGTRIHQAARSSFTDATGDQGTASLDAWMLKYQATNPRRVFARSFEDPRSGSLSTTTEEKLERIKHEHPHRSRRIPAGQSVSGLENIYVFSIPEGVDPWTAAAALSDDQNVVYAHPNVSVRHCLDIPNDPYYWSSRSWGQDYEDLWGLHHIHAEGAWAVTQGEGIVVAVIDSGVDYHHPDIWANIWVNPDIVPDLDGDGDIDLDDADTNGNGQIDAHEIENDMLGWDFWGYDSDPMDECGHGTHVSGTIAATGNNGLGIVGVAPKARIMPVRFLGPEGWGSVDDAAAAIEYATDHGADILSNSWGGPGNFQVLTDAANYALAAGVVVVAAAGNDTADVDSKCPANIDSVIAVAATNQLDQRASFSNWGLRIAVGAPGGGTPAAPGIRNILSLKSEICNPVGCRPELIVDSIYLRQAGTSMACPHVSGVAALLLASDPTLTPVQIRARLESCAAPYDPLPDYPLGAGLLNAAQAVAGENTPFVKLIEYSQRSPALPGQSCELELRLIVANLETPLTAELTSFDPDIVITQADSLFLPDAANYTASNHAAPFVLMYVGPEDLLTGVVDFELAVPEAGLSLPISIRLGITQLPGWPKSLPAYANAASPAVADLNGDRSPDLVIASGTTPMGTVHAFQSDGTELSGWPVQTPGPVFLSSPAIADLDHDESPEVVVGDADGHVYAWHADGSPVSGWPVLGGGNINAAPAIADLDGDGSLDIVAITAQAQVRAWNGNGVPLPGWPQHLGGTPEVLAAPAVEDLDGDGSWEVIAGAGVQVHAWHGDGRTVDGWPQAVSDNIMSSPAIADLDGDGSVEIVVGTGSTVEAFHADGMLVAGWPKRVRYPVSSPPAIADLDTYPETREVVVVSQAGIVHVWDANGNALDGWPREMEEPVYYTSPVIADLDGDRSLEIIVGTGEAGFPGAVHAFRSDGADVPGWPIPASGAVISSPAIADLNNDGTLEVIAIGITNSLVDVWDVPNPSPDPAPWPMFRRDLRNTGYYPEIPSGCTDSDLNGDGRVGVRDFLMLLAAWGHNPDSAADINHDGFVDEADLTILVGSWGPCIG